MFEIDSGTLNFYLEFIQIITYFDYFCMIVALGMRISCQTGFRPYSLMDRISDSGSDGCGSIPHGGTNLKQHKF